MLYFIYKLTSLKNRFILILRTTKGQSSIRIICWKLKVISSFLRSFRLQHLPYKVNIENSLPTICYSNDANVVRVCKRSYGYLFMINWIGK